MSTTIDQKVVEMRFDNKQFEANVATTMNSVERLQKSLNFKNSAKGMEELEYAAYKVGFHWEDVKNKMISILEYDIAGKLKNQLMGVTKALTITPITTGFNEYELKMGSIQTIMAGTGEDLETVNKYLGELNEYSDKTIYSFQDMTSNIGKFTNAGVSLEDSVAAIKGVSNVAAVSGANANEASRAMYNFAQALSSGYVKLIDWKSIELANMGTVEFKNQLLEAAVAEGKLTKTSDGLYKTLSGTTVSATKNFNDSLKDEWMTTEVLIGTLKKYADESTEIGKKATKAATEVKTLSQLYDTLKESAQSGWAQTWEIIIGDFEEAKKFLSELNELIGGMIGRSAEARNELLENWKVLGGRDDVIQSFRNIVKAITAFVKPIKEAFGEVFSPLTSEGLKSFTEGFKNFTEGLILTDNAADNLRRIFKGVFSVIDIGVEIFKGLWDALGLVTEGADDLGGGLLGVLVIIGDALTAVARFIKETKIIRNVFTIVGKAIRTVFILIGKLTGTFNGAFESGPLEIFTGLFENLAYMIDSVANSAEGLGKSFKDAFKQFTGNLKNNPIIQAISGIWNGIKQIALKIGQVIGGIFKAIGDAFATGDLNTAFEIINTILDGGVLVLLGTFIKKLIDLFKAPNEIIDAISDVFGTFEKYLKSLSLAINAQALETIAKAVGILVLSLIALTFVNPEKLDEALAAITLAFGELLIMFAVINKIGQSGGVKQAASEAINSMSSVMGMMIGLLLMTVVIKKLGSMDWETLGKGLIGVVVLLGVMTGVMMALSKFEMVSKKVIKTHNGKSTIKYVNAIRGMTTIAMALLIMSVPFKIIGSMDWASWGRGLIGITVLLGAMAGVQIALSRLGKDGGKTMLQGSGAMMMVATSLLLMAVPFTIIGLLPWETLAKGLIGVTVLLGAMSGVQIALTRLAQNGKTMLAGAGSLVIMAASIMLVIPPVLALGLLPFGVLLQGLLGLGTLLAGMAGVQVLLSNLGSASGKMVAGAASLAIMAASIGLIMPSLLILGNMDTTKLLQAVIALGVVLSGLAGISILLSEFAGTSVIGAASIAIMAGSILILTAAITTLALIPVALLVKSLVALAAGILVFVAAAALIGNPAIAGGLLTASVAITAFGIALMTITGALVLLGVSLPLIASGLLALAGVFIILEGSLGILATGITTLVASIIVGVLKGIGEGFVVLGEIIMKALPVLAGVIIELIKAVCDIIIECAPNIAETILVVIVEILGSLSKHTPTIVGYLMDLLVGVIKAFAEKLPDLGSAIGELIMGLLQATIAALGDIDPEVLTQALLSIGKLTLIMAALNAMVLLTPGAMAGCIGMGLVVAELSLVLAALGKLASIPGLNDLIHGGGDLLMEVGTAIGKFVGGLVGGLSAGVMASLPLIGQSLTDFMTKVQGFIDGARQVDSTVVNGATSLVGIILALTGANLLEKLTRFIGGKSSLSDFGNQLVDFAPKIKQYADTVAGIDGTAVEASANAARCLSELASNLPNSGGLLGKIVGENDLSTFGDMLVPFGEGIKKYSETVTGLDTAAIESSVPAAKALVELADTIPNTGGLVSFFAGDNTLDVFGNQLVAFGKGIKDFAVEVSGLKDDGSITTAVNVAKSLVDLSNNIPNEGGIVAWITGENAIANFAWSLGKLGGGIKSFADEVTGLDSEAVIAAANAGKVIAEMTNTIPNEGGVVGWFTGENSIANFASQLPILGQGLSGFAMSTAGIAVDSVTAAAQACKVLAEMTSIIPNEGGVVGWFSGESSISKFGEDLVSLGQGIKGFADATVGINSESVLVAADACKSLAEITSVIPNENGIKSWFSGESSLSKFGGDLSALGQGMKGFSDATVGINVESVSAAATAAKNLADMVSVIPSEGGIKAYFAGERSLSKFAGEIPKLGDGLAGFSESVAEINCEKVTAGATAAKTLAEMTKSIPSEGGIKVWFSGDKSIANFAGKLPGLGKGLAGFSKEVAGINPENVKAAASAAKSLAEMAETAPKDSDKIITFGDNLKKFGDKLKEYFNVTKGITAESTSTASKALDQIKQVASINAGNIKSVAEAINSLTKAIKQMVTDIKTDLHKAGKEAIEAFISGIDEKLSAAKAACKGILDGCVDAISGKASSFESAGKAVVTGFCSGITQNTYKAEAKAAAMAKAAADAAKAELDINSPSKVFREIGGSVPEGFAQGIDKFGTLVKGSSRDMAQDAIDSVRHSLSNLANVVNKDIDSQPTIRPVLDLTDIRSGASAINGMFSGQSLGIAANVGSISTMMNRNIQNGANDDVVTAIDSLRKDLNNMEHASYSIGNVTFSGDAEVEEAFNTIIRAVTRARRT